jgi:uncharacterized protein with HEPN domain
MKDDTLYRYHIMESIDKITTYIDGINQNDFANTPLIQDAVLRNLQVLAESTQRLSSKFKENHPEIEWYKIAGLRNILAHDYLGIDLDTVWNVIKSYLPKLRAAIAI